jgi:histidinol-phosphatase (PHP family)
MLTDYHLHLRPDEEGTTFERYFTAENVERYLDAAAAAGIEELGVSEHVYRFRAALDLWQHPLWVENAVDDLDAYCEFVRSTPLRLGIECDYIPGAEERIEALLGARDFDYVVGSVHFIGDGDAAIDHKGFDVWEGDGDPDEIWRRYFAMLADAARSGLFDILAHPDLVKVWGRATPLPDRDLRAGSASRSASSTPRASSPRCASRRAPPSPSPPTLTCPSRSASNTSARCSSWTSWE